VSRGDGTGVWLPAGVVGAIALGIALIPLRALTSASNLAFASIALTIVVAELGGRAAALATAVVSAMSLNFFLTEPYLTLLITKTEDHIAFVALAACGLIAAAFGQRRERWSAAVLRTRQDLEALERLVSNLEAGAPLDRTLGELRRAFGLGTLVLRDTDERVLAAAPPGAERRATPDEQLQPRTLLAPSAPWHTWGVRGFRLPEGGGRLRRQTDRGPAWLDLWEGDPAGLGVDDRRTLALAAAILGRELSRRTGA